MRSGYALWVQNFAKQGNLPPEEIFVFKNLGMVFLKVVSHVIMMFNFIGKKVNPTKVTYVQSQMRVHQITC